MISPDLTLDRLTRWQDRAVCRHNNFGSPFCKPIEAISVRARHSHAVLMWVTCQGKIRYRIGCQNCPVLWVALTYHLVSLSGALSGGILNVFGFSLCLAMAKVVFFTAGAFLRTYISTLFAKLTLAGRVPIDSIDKSGDRTLRTSLRAKKFTGKTELWESSTFTIAWMAI